jgi:hypothetical protein
MDALLWTATQQCCNIREPRWLQREAKNQRA